MLKYINIFVGSVVAIAIYFLFFAYSPTQKTEEKASQNLLLPLWAVFLAIKSSLGYNQEKTK